MTFWGYLPTNRGFQHFYGIPLWHMGDEGNQSQVPSYSFHRSLPFPSPLSFLYMNFANLNSDPGCPADEQLDDHWKAVR